MNEAVYGLGDQAQVKYNGVTVGYVDHIDLVPDNLQQVKLTVKIEEDVPITESTEGTLKAQGITGNTYIGLETTTAEAPLLRAEAGEPYPIIKSNPSFLVQLSDALRELSRNLASISKNFQRIFDDENTMAFKDSLQNVKKVTEVLAKNGNNINDSLTAANKLLKNSAQASERFPDLAKKLDDALGSVKDLSKNVTTTSNEIRVTMQHGQHAIDGLSTQAVPEAVQLLNRLNTMTTNLESLTSELKQNPTVIIRGRQPPTPGPGE